MDNKKVSGVLISDKCGDLMFLNSKHLDNLAKDPETIPCGNQEGADTFDYVAKQVYSHQQTCTGMCLSPCGRYLIAMDTLHKINVLNFPRVVQLQSVNTD